MEKKTQEIANLTLVMIRELKKQFGSEATLKEVERKWEDFIYK
jgi:hypothetical protein